MTIHSVFLGYINMAFDCKNLKIEGGIICGGEDRTRTCKRSPAVVFKTTALPIRLPLRPSRRHATLERKNIPHRRRTSQPNFDAKKAPAVSSSRGTREDTDPQRTLVGREQLRYL